MSKPKREAVKVLRRYLRSLEPRFFDPSHLVKWLRKRGYKIVRRK